MLFSSLCHSTVDPNSKEIVVLSMGAPETGGGKSVTLRLELELEEMIGLGLEVVVTCTSV
jgi:hypothetical protein